MTIHLTHVKKSSISHLQGVFHPDVCAAVVWSISLFS